MNWRGNVRAHRRRRERLEGLGLIGERVLHMPAMKVVGRRPGKRLQQASDDGPGWGTVAAVGLGLWLLS